LWLGLIALDGLVVVLMIVLIMRFMGNWRLGEVRDAIVNRANETWTYQGEAIPGAKPGLIARLVVRLLGRDGTSR
jgi:hypothetical protein